MTDEKKCPQCGAELPADAPAGICPKCLLEVGMASDTAVRGEQSDHAPTTPLPGSSRFNPPAASSLAKLFPQLEILELIGAGGMGAVYKARQPGLDRFVAIKILPPEVGADPAFAQRFTREAQSLGRLGHQHIVSVYDFGEAGGLYYFVMEYVDGANLRQLIKTGGLKPAEALAIVPQICEALQFAHDEGVVHRDIKPENILLDKRGRVKIADFGLARLLGNAAPELSLTGTNQVLGTLHYMAPEQIQGLRTVDHRADIYSLGVVFYEMLTGELPLGRFAPPSQKVEVDVRLDEVVLRSLESEPQRRYQKASQVKTDVERISVDSAAVNDGRRDDIQLAGRPPVDAASSAANTMAERSIQKLANALLVIGGLGLLVVILLPIWLTFDGAARFFGAKPTSQSFGHGRNVFTITAFLTFYYALIGLPHALLIIVAALFMRNRRGYWLAFAACVLAALPVTFVTPIGLPIGLWGLAVLTSPEVRAAFAREASNDRRTPSERLFWPAIGLLLAAVIDAGQAILFFGEGVSSLYRRNAHDLFEVVTIGAIAVVLGGLRLVGGMQLLKLKSLGWCKFASTASLMPASFGSVIGLPAGIWALFELVRPDVKKAFGQVNDRDADVNLHSFAAGIEPKADTNALEHDANRSVAAGPAHGGSAMSSSDAADEQQRAAKLVERPPYWLDFGATGLFGLGWILAGAMWNFRWPGLAMAIAVMAAITYGVVRWKVVYVPRLRAELSRQSRFRRGFALSMGLFLFFVAMFLLMVAQTYAWDFFHTSFFRSFNFEEKDQTVRNAVLLAKFEGLGKDAIVSSGGWGGGTASSALPWLSCLFCGWLGVVFLFWSVSTVIDTRRFRGSWKYFWGPSLSISFACVALLPGVQAVRTLVMGYSASTVSPREIRFAGSSEQVAAVIDRWTEEMGYAGGGWYIEIVERQKTVGKVSVVELWQDSPFDRYRLSWRHGVLRPRPAMSVACVTTNDPAQAYVRVELPIQNMGSPEETMWRELLDDLETEIRAAAKPR